jgi:hypothetical protein
MARWAVIRVRADEGQAAQRALVEAYAPVTMTINLNPPAAGPEHEIAVQDRAEALVCRLLEAVGISVLAHKTEIRAPMERPG